MDTTTDSYVRPEELNESNDDVIITRLDNVSIKQYPGDAPNMTLQNKKSSSRISISNCRTIQIGNNNTMIVSGGMTFFPTRKCIERSRKLPGDNEQVSRLSDITTSTALPRQEDLVFVSGEMGKKWKKVARHLGLEDSAIEHIEMDYFRDGVQEMAWQVLRVWQQRDGKGATLRVLAEALFNSGKTSTAKKLK